MNARAEVSPLSRCAAYLATGSTARPRKWLRYWVVSLVFGCCLGGCIGWLTSEQLPECHLNLDQRPLSLLDQADRDHLRADVQAIGRAASHFGDEVRRLPALSDSPDAVEGKRTAAARGESWCRTTLLSSLSVAHRLAVSEVAALAREFDAPPDRQRH